MVIFSLNLIANLHQTKKLLSTSYRLIPDLQGSITGIHQESVSVGSEFWCGQAFSTEQISFKVTTIKIEYVNDFEKYN